jgi:cyclopropane-fatty-acyl-phospholipid synthase
MAKGFYHKHSSTQATAVSSCTGLLQTAAQQVPIHSSSTLSIAEWGCAHGGNSIAPVYTISETLAQRMATQAAAGDSSLRELQLHVTHTDVVQNSWSELFACAKQYQQKVQESLTHLSVTYAGIGSSQYERNHPDRSLDLGFSYNALHWLSKGVHLKHTMSPFGSKVCNFQCWFVC